MRSNVAEQARTERWFAEHGMSWCDAFYAQTPAGSIKVRTTAAARLAVQYDRFDRTLHLHQRGQSVLLLGAEDYEQVSLFLTIDPLGRREIFYLYGEAE